MVLKELAGDAAAGETRPALARSFPAPFRNAAPGMFLLRCSPLMSTVTSRRPLLFACNGERRRRGGSQHGNVSKQRERT